MSNSALIIFESWHYFIIPISKIASFKRLLPELEPRIGWPDQGIRWRNDSQELLLGIPAGEYYGSLKKIVNAFEITYNEMLILAETPAWKVENIPLP